MSTSILQVSSKVFEIQTPLYEQCASLFKDIKATGHTFVGGAVDLLRSEDRSTVITSSLSGLIRVSPQTEGI